MSASLRRMFIGSTIAALGLASASAQTLLVPAWCAQTNPVNYVFTARPSDIQQTLDTTANWITRPWNVPFANFQPYWDVRYVNPSSVYGGGYAEHLGYTGIAGASASAAWAAGTYSSLFDASGSIAQSKCVDDYLAFGVMVSGHDAPGQILEGGGMQAALKYQFVSQGSPDAGPVRPWKPDGTGNLMLQGYFSRPYYSGPGVGQVSFNVFLSRISNPAQLVNLVIIVYASNASENPSCCYNEGVLGHDPSSNADALNTFVGNATRYSTKSAYSPDYGTARDSALAAESWPTFYRSNITYANLRNILTDLANVGMGGGSLDPSDWAVKEVSVFFENFDFNAALAGSVRAFEIYSGAAAF